MAISRYLTAALLAATIAAPASAATVVVNAVVNSTNLLPNVFNTVAITPVTLNVGDTLDLTLTFSTGLVTLTGGTPLWTALLTGSGSGSIQTTSVMSILGGSANLVTSTAPLAQTNSFVHVGSYFFNNLIQTSSGSISFTGINQLLTLDSDDIGGPREYDTAFFYFETSQIGGVPEPASWAMMIAGFGLVGAAARRRRTIAA